MILKLVISVVVGGFLVLQVLPKFSTHASIVSHVGAQGARASSSPPKPNRLSRKREGTSDFNTRLEISQGGSFRSRAEAYCKSVTNPGVDISTGMSIEQLQIAYRKLLKSEPETREGEESRQQALSSVTRALASLEIAAVENLQTCEWLVISGFTKISSEAAVRPPMNLSLDNPYRFEEHYSGLTREETKTAHDGFLAEQSIWEREHGR